MSHDEIDQTILDCCQRHWAKVARVAFDAAKLLGVPKTEDIDFLGPRIKALVKAGKLEAEGNLDRWGFSEIRLSGKPAGT